MQPFGFLDSIVFKVVLIVFLLEAGWPLLIDIEISGSIRSVLVMLWTTGICHIILQAYSIAPENWVSCQSIFESFCAGILRKDRNIAIFAWICKR